MFVCVCAWVCVCVRVCEFTAGMSGRAGRVGRNRYLGTDSGILQQHSRPDSRVAGHKAPVAADLGGMQEGAGVQVGEDAEQGGSHLEDLWADDLIGT